MKKLFLLILLSLSLTSISYEGYLDDWSDDQYCGWMDNPSPPAHIIAEVKKRGISCKGGVAIKIVKAPIVKGSILVSKLKSWTKMLRGKRPIYTTKGGTQIKVEPLDDEKSITLNKLF